MKIAEARRRVGQLVLSYHGLPAGAPPRGPFTLQAVTRDGHCYFKDKELDVEEPHPCAALVLNETYPVDYDDQNDPDCPKTGAAAAYAAVAHVECTYEHLPDGGTVIVWPKDTTEQIARRLDAMGWAVTRTRAWKK